MKPPPLTICAQSPRSMRWKRSPMQVKTPVYLPEASR